MKKAKPAAMRPDLGPLPDLIGYVLRRAQISVFKDFNRMFEKADIRPAQYSVLCVIERNPGLTQSAVAEALGIKRANFVVLFNTLEERGLARRAVGREDRRSHALTLTPAGKTFVAGLHALARRHEQNFSAAMTAEERRQLFSLLNTLRRRGRELRDVDTSKRGE